MRVRALQTEGYGVAAPEGGSITQPNCVCSLSVQVNASLKRLFPPKMLQLLTTLILELKLLRLHKVYNHYSVYWESCIYK